jgi:hypothetical protein
MRVSETPLRAALERLDESIDRMEAALAVHEASLPQAAAADGELPRPDPRLSLVADRLDRVIQKLEGAGIGAG